MSYDRRVTDHRDSSGGPGAMIVDRYDPLNLFALVPKLQMEFEPELAELDRLLEDDVLFRKVRADLARRRPESLTRGRHSTPVEVVLRMLVVRRLYGWCYEDTERFVSDRLVLRQFCRVYRGSAPAQGGGGARATDGGRGRGGETAGAPARPVRAADRAGDRPGAAAGPGRQGGAGGREGGQPVRAAHGGPPPRQGRSADRVRAQGPSGRGGRRDYQPLRNPGGQPRRQRPGRARPGRPHRTVRPSPRPARGRPRLPQRRERADRRGEGRAPRRPAQAGRQVGRTPAARASGLVPPRPALPRRHRR